MGLVIPAYTTPLLKDRTQTMAWQAAQEHIISINTLRQKTDGRDETAINTE